MPIQAKAVTHSVGVATVDSTVHEKRTRPNLLRVQCPNHHAIKPHASQYIGNKYDELTHKFIMAVHH